jgi:hypothetical protein
VVTGVEVKLVVLCQHEKKEENGGMSLARAYIEK